MISAMSTALKGIHTHMESINRTAHRIAQPGPNENLPEDMVQMILDKHGVKANAAVLRASDQMLGTLLDIVA